MYRLKVGDSDEGALIQIERERVGELVEVSMRLRSVGRSSWDLGVLEKWNGESWEPLAASGPVAKVARRIER